MLFKSYEHFHLLTTHGQTDRWTHGQTHTCFCIKDELATNMSNTERVIYSILSSEINAYQKPIKVISITSKMI